MKEVVFLNGKFLPATEARICVLAPGFLLGLGLFETMRSYNKKIIYFDHHLKRITDSCKLIDMKPRYSAAKLKKIINEAVAINGFKDSYVRLTLSKSEKGSDTIVLVKKYSPYPSGKYNRGFSVSICNFIQNENFYFAQLKTTSRAVYELEFKQARKKGFDEGLILNNSGYLAEGTRSNLFLAKGKTLFTPVLSCGCLNGITRRAILDLASKHKIKTQEGNFTLQDLYNAEEAFLTNSLMGVMPLTQVSKHAIGKGRRASLTKFFREKYNSMLK